MPESNTQPRPCCFAALFTRASACINPTEIGDREPAAPPKALLAFLLLTLLTMFSQIKLPIAGGRLALADPFAGLAFLAILWHSWKYRERIFYPATGAILLALAAITNFFAQPGVAGAIEVAQLVQQFFCGILIFSWLLRHSPKTARTAVTLALLLNAGLALWQTIQYGYASIQPPADVKALPWGFGFALTGLFRSRMALSFFMAAGLAWVQPQWLGRRPGVIRMAATLLLTLTVLCFIPHGMMLLLACLALLLAAFCLGRRAVIVNLLAMLLLLLSLCLGTHTPHSRTVRDTLFPGKTGQFAGELKTCHLDFIAALRLAGQRPLTGVGSGRYQECVGRCYGDLPNPSYNDIDSDTQAGWGILAATLGWPVTIMTALALLAAIATGLARFFRGERQVLHLPTETNLGGAAALIVFAAGMCISDPLTRGLGWMLGLALSAATLPYDRREVCGGCGSSWLKTTATLAALTLLLLPVALRPQATDPLRHSTPAGGRAPRRTAAASTGTRLASNTPLGEVFMIINPSQAKEITPPFEKYSDSQAAEGTALRILDGKGVPPETEEPDMKHGGARFEFELATAAECKIWLRVWWDGSCGNTVNLRVNDEPRSVTIGNDGTYHTWHWLESPKTYTLPAGKHTLQVLNREDGIALDQILITTDKDYYPQGIEETP